MAILSKIRERSMFLILVIGLALFAFVLDPSTISDFFSANKVNEIGSVNGETISRQEFAEALDAYKAQTGNRASEMQAAKTVWNNLLRQKIYKSQLEEAGITVGDEDIMNQLYSDPSVQNDVRFQTAGIFDKAKLKSFLKDAKSEQGDLWKSLTRSFTNIKSNIQKTTYDNLVAAGLGASLKEGEVQYMNENTKMTAKYVYVPYTSIADSLVTLTKGDVRKYIESQPDNFQVEASRDIKVVRFDINPTAEDEAALKADVAKLIEDTEDRGAIIKGLKNTTDYAEFLEETESDIALDNGYKYKVQVPQVIAEDIFNGKQGDVFGPYKDGEYFKLSKITEVTQLPDSVKSSHILVPFAGALRAGASVTKTEDEAKKTADSIFNLVKNNKSRFTEIADEINTDGSKGKGGDIGWTAFNVAFSPQFDIDFANYIFTNKKNDIKVVKTKFGYHVIRIDDQKNFQSVVKLATFGRKIEASEATENKIFQDAETFALALANGQDIEEVAKEKELNTLPVVGLKSLDENVPSVGNERSIVTWAFGNDLEVGDSKRFDINGGYVVAVLTGKTEKGLMPVDKAISQVRAILTNEKKAELIEAKMSGSTLQEIATAAGQTVRTASDVNMQSPTLSGVGNAPKVVGAMLNAKENQVYNKVAGDRGVFAFVVEKKELPTALPNYDTFRKRIAGDRKNKTFQMYEAVKKASDVEDRLSSFYGIE